MTDPTESERPLVTFALFAYNQEQYIREAVEGAFAQTYQPLEIILSDDCSTDRTYEIMREMAAAYEGPHRVVVRQSAGNRGIASHFSEVISDANGAFVVIAAGDDISYSIRTEKSVAALMQDNGVSFVEMEKDEFLDAHGAPRLYESGKQGGPCEPAQEFELDKYIYGKAPSLCGAARAIRRVVWDAFGPLCPDCPTEDTPSVLRLLLSGKGCKLAVPGIARRIHGKSLSAPESMKQMRLEEIGKQFEADLSRARDLDLISHVTCEAVLAWSKHTIRRRELRRLIESGQLTLFEVIGDIIPSRALKPREKLYALQRLAFPWM